MSEITVHESAIKRILNLRQKRGDQGLMLRITVEGGGCSGFQYKLSLSTDKNADDHIYEDYVITDDISLPLIAGSIVRFEEGLVGAEFKIDNPNAVMGCGCGTSFSV